MGLHRVAELVDAFYGRVASRVETDGVMGAGDVFVDGGRDPYRAHAPGGQIHGANELLSSRQMYNQDWNKTKTVEVPFADYSSDGTKWMYELSDAFSKAVEGSAVIVIDETMVMNI